MLQNLTDKELITQTKTLVAEERKVLTEILNHLSEINRRKLFSDFGCQSLFEYCTRELGYSAGQASRRIGAIRVIADIPEVEEKIESGDLSLSNVAQAQSFFRESAKANSPIPSSEKKKLLKSLENTSTREAQKILMSQTPHPPLPKETTKMVSKTHTQLNFVANEALLLQLEKVRSLLGPKGLDMSLGELVEKMAELAQQALEQKRFGKSRVRKSQKSRQQPTPDPAPDLAGSHHVEIPAGKGSKNQRYLSAAVKHQVWIRDKGCCQKCGGRRNLNFDHVRPVALGGDAKIENLRLLCFHCNQRQVIRNSGIKKMKQSWVQQ